MADEIVDTSDMTVHELRQFFMGLSRDRSRAGLVVTLLSFGFKHGVPVDADLMFDVRCLPNPHFVPALRRRTGRDRAVARFMERDASTREFMDRLEEYPALRRAALHRRREELPDGRHRLHRRPARSVMIAERLRPRRLASTSRARRAGLRVTGIGTSRLVPIAMIGVVVVTHGQLATELVNAAEMIVGDLPQFTAVSIGWHDDVNDAREDIAQAIERVRGDGGRAAADRHVRRHAVEPRA